VGETVKTGLLSRFTVVFKELNKAGLPIVEALEISQRSIENGYVKKKFSQSIITVQKGMSLTEAFKEAGMYENMTMQMLRAGEQSGSLGDMLDKISDYYSKKFQSKMDNISASIEPVLITMLAGLVLLLALGIFMPMWDMAKAIR
jgi:type II secretory pathway component PulF